MGNERIIVKKNLNFKLGVVNASGRLYPMSLKPHFEKPGYFQFGAPNDKTWRMKYSLDLTKILGTTTSKVLEDGTIEVEIKLFERGEFIAKLFEEDGIDLVCAGVGSVEPINGVKFVGEDYRLLYFYIASPTETV